jgi:hypothetical protein
MPCSSVIIRRGYELRFLGCMGCILLDSGKLRDTVTRIANRAGWKVTVETKPGEGFRLLLTK